MTLEQMHYDRMSPENWRRFKINTKLFQLRTGRSYLIHQESNGVCEFNIMVIHAFGWDTALLQPDGYTGWGQVSRNA